MKKVMADENQKVSADAGSTEESKVVPEESGETTENVETTEESVSKDQYEELERKLGQQGTELGDLRSFFKSVEPLLDKLTEQPDLTDAIMEGKITNDLALAVVEGKIAMKEAKEVAKAHEDIKKTMSPEQYKQADPASIEKMVEEKLSKATESLKKELKTGITEVEERRTFENSVVQFIENTKDFDVYADQVVKWLDEHPDQYDIETAYLAIKGRAASVEAAKGAERQAVEEGKNLARNAAGGGSQNSQVISDNSIIDKLISPRSNPNAL